MIGLDYAYGSIYHTLNARFQKNTNAWDAQRVVPKEKKAKEKNTILPPGKHHIVEAYYIPHLQRNGIIFIILADIKVMKMEHFQKVILKSHNKNYNLCHHPNWTN